MVKLQHSQYNIQQNLRLRLITLRPTPHIPYKHILHILAMNVLVIAGEGALLLLLFLGGVVVVVVVVRVVRGTVGVVGDAGD